VLREAHGRLSTFRPQDFTTFLDPSDPTIQSNLAALRASGCHPRERWMGNFTILITTTLRPRLGLAWDVFSNARLFVRAAIGAFL